MIYDLLKFSPHPNGHSDVCIVGAGAAGISLAIELARSGVCVTLLEGGGADIEDRAQEPYLGECSFLNHRGLHEGRFRAFGGTTTRWGGQILELNDIDFERRSWVAGSGWPFPKSELTRHYERALQIEGLSAAQSDGAVWKSLRGKNSDMPGMNAYLSRWCPEPNFAKLHGEDIATSTGIDLWLHANAVELILDDARVTGIHAQTQTGKAATFTARDFIFCMGAIESSRFFLQPRASGLPWNRSGLLGRHFQDHIDCNAATFHPKNLGELRRGFDGIFHKGFKYQPRIRLAEEKQKELQTLNVGSSFAYTHANIEGAWRVRATARQLLERRFSSINASDLGHLIRNAGFVTKQGLRYALQKRSFQPSEAAISLRVHCEQEPLSRSRVELTTDKDSLGLFRTRLHWLISPLELKSIRSYVASAQSSLKELGQVVPLEHIEDDAVLTSACEDSFHHMGGMRMHDSPSQGVVDCNLKLHGMRNVWVCSSAVFPTSGFSNPTHTLMALTMRLARHLTRSNEADISPSANAEEIEERVVATA